MGKRPYVLEGPGFRPCMLGLCDFPFHTNQRRANSIFFFLSVSLSLSLFVSVSFWFSFSSLLIFLIFPLVSSFALSVSLRFSSLPSKMRRWRFCFCSSWRLAGVQRSLFLNSPRTFGRDFLICSAPNSWNVAGEVLASFRRPCHDKL